ncbi:DNA-directed RNA polymerase subunit RPC12/RpoP [Scopulibacillus daqui]|uniref:DNA-directed RNA polymerase subunit RPC12/RpoP n=1 Tax=Scopulibacillus daqui TaxID=1469162 RepID=A0ABS2Q258_9BACL|nr:hypothetical protein [Scopulibacillus daqui]MBM7646379.1 DNA-directed RNA polymerase subunit RPC12/RpoP [Scopulibacillus daqui]
MQNIFTVLECRKCNKAYNVKPEKMLAHYANIHCPHCGAMAKMPSALEKYYHSMNDFKQHLSGAAKT